MIKNENLCLNHDCKPEEDLKFSSESEDGGDEERQEFWQAPQEDTFSEASK